MLLHFSLYMLNISNFVIGSVLKLHKPSTRLSIYHKSVYYNSINVYNRLPDAIAELVTDKKFFS